MDRWMDGKTERQTGRYKDEWIEGEAGGWREV
jgi:hypothetical protein